MSQCYQQPMHTFKHTDLGRLHIVMKHPHMVVKQPRNMPFQCTHVALPGVLWELPACYHNTPHNQKTTHFVPCPVHIHVPPLVCHPTTQSPIVNQLCNLLFTLLEGRLQHALYWCSGEGSSDVLRRGSGRPGPSWRVMPYTLCYFLCNVGALLQHIR